MVADGDMIDALIVFILSALLRNYLAALDGQMEAETTEEQP